MTAATIDLDLAAIRAAARAIEAHVVTTECRYAAALSDLLGLHITIKCETQQYTSSFKDRGACNKLLQLGEAQRARGVIAMSAGNHAQGVAHFATRLAIPSTIVMPTSTPFVKIEKTRQLGAKVVLEGAMIDEAAAHARALAERDGATLIHPYDDAHVIAGQGTIALEILGAVPELDALVVPIGGGGLIAGISTAAKALKPSIKIIGVQAANVPSMYCQLHDLPYRTQGATIAEGIAVKTPGALTAPIIKDKVDHLLLVEEPDLEQAILALLEHEKLVVEGAGAAGLAALLAYPRRFRGLKIGLVLCGGNIDSRLLSEVILRGLVRDQRIVQLRISVPDQPGSLAKLTDLVAKEGGNIVEVQHRRAFSAVSLKSTTVNLVIETRNSEHATEIATALRLHGFDCHLIERGG